MSKATRKTSANDKFINRRLLGERFFLILKKRKIKKKECPKTPDHAKISYRF